MWKAFWKAAMATAMLALMVCEVDGALSCKWGMTGGGCKGWMALLAVHVP